MSQRRGARGSVGWGDRRRTVWDVGRVAVGGVRVGEEEAVRERVDAKDAAVCTKNARASESVLKPEAPAARDGSALGEEQERLVLVVVALREGHVWSVRCARARAEGQHGGSAAS